LARTNRVTYYGYFRNSKFHGKGKMTFAQNDEQGRKHYLGYFEKGQFHGDGMVLMQNGDMYKAKWERNKLLGQGVYTWSNGIRSRFKVEPN